MNIEIKATGEPHEYKELLPYSNAIERDLFLQNLFSNFFRQWKHSEEDPSLDEIKEKLYELKQEYNVILND